MVSKTQACRAIELYGTTARLLQNYPQLLRTQCSLLREMRHEENECTNDSLLQIDRNRIRWFFDFFAPYRHTSSNFLLTQYGDGGVNEVFGRRTWC